MSGAKFITLEGLDGAGKTTHLDWLARFVTARGITCRLTREPGGTALGEKLRALLLDPAQDFHVETETLLMFAARREHIDKVIAPALAAGHWIICDRFTDASFAYQAGGSGAAWTKIEALERWVQGPLEPDLTVYFDVSPQVARARTRAVRAPDRFEQEQAAFHARVRDAYLRRARENPGRVRVIAADLEISQVQRALETLVIAALFPAND